MSGGRRRDKTRIAVVGLGMALKPHLEALRDLSHRVEIAACYAPSPARREAFRAVYSLPVASDLDTVLDDATIDAVLLLTPPNTHLELVERAAAAGKHVLLEKPVEVSLVRARRAVEAMERAGLRLGIVLQHRFRSASRRLAGLVSQGVLGPLVSGSAWIRWWRPPEYYAEPGRGMKARDGGGVLMTQAIHTLDLFQSLTGPISHVAAFTATSPLRAIDTEDIAAAAVRFANGAIGSIDATTVSYPGFPERVELACRDATAVIEGETLDVLYKDGRRIREEGGENRSGGADPMAFSHDAHKALISDFLDALDQGRAPLVGGREALRVHALIEAILESSATCRVVEISRI